MHTISLDESLLHLISTHNFYSSAPPGPAPPGPGPGPSPPGPSPSGELKCSYNIKGAPDEDDRREEGSGNSGLQQKALRFAPFLFFIGLEEAFVNGVWPKIFAPNQDQVHTIPLVFVLWACMEAMGSTVSGVVSDHVGRKPVIAFGVRAVPAKEPPF